MMEDTDFYNIILEVYTVTFTIYEWGTREGCGYQKVRIIGGHLGDRLQ